MEPIFQTGEIDIAKLKVSANGIHPLTNKVVIITGASSGIGRALAFKFACHGAIVILAARNKENLLGVKEKIKLNGGRAEIKLTDVTHYLDCELLIKSTLKDYGRIDVLVNNAGISMRANFIDVKISVLRRLMNTNFWGTVYCTKLALPHLLESKGSLVAISSICGITPLPGRTGYCASKHALDGFIESVRVENLNSDMHVLTVHPGFTTSNIRKSALNKDGKEQAETPRDENKMMSAEEVAKEVIDGILEHKRDIILTLEGKLITWIYKRMPGLAEKLLFEEMHKETGSPV